MTSIILNTVLAYLFMYLGGFIARINTEEKESFKHQVCLWWSAIILPQAIWLFVPVGFNVFFLIFALFYFNVGYFLLTNNRFYDDGYTSEWDFRSDYRIWLILHLLVLSFFLFSSTKYFQGEKFGNLIEVVELKNENAIKDFYYEPLEGEVRYIPYHTAFHLAKKALSESTSSDVTLGTVLKINEYASSIQVVRNETYWVFPLEYEGFHKQRNYGAIDAYIIVEAKTQDPVAELVRSGLDRDVTFSMEKSIGGYLNRNLIRDFHSSYPTRISDSFKIVLDDNFVPYMVAYNIKANVGLRGFAPESVIIYDFSSDTYSEYSIEESPEWLEINFSLDITKELINDWGSYRKGFWDYIGNTFATKLTDYIYGTGNDMFFVPTKNGFAWFSGMTSESENNDSLVDTVFVDTRTGKATIIKSKGTDENGVIGAVQSTLGKDSDNWQAVMPLKYLINNDKEIWIMPIVSKQTNLVIKMAVVDAHNVNKVAIGNNLESALNKFSQLVDYQDKLIESMEKETLSGIIEAFNMVGFNESIISFIRLQDSPNTVIECNTSTIKQCLILKTGDTVTFEVVEQKDNTKLVTDFKF